MTARAEKSDLLPFDRFKLVANLAGEQDGEDDQHHNTSGIKGQLDGCKKLVVKQKIEPCGGYQDKQKRYRCPQDPAAGNRQAWRKR